MEEEKITISKKEYEKLLTDSLCLVFIKNLIINIEKQ